ncbi:MAG: hypothetical protein SPI72_05940 [Porphyromonas sp.]|nr:hypothetical protein [Porphyromonas sp.]
MKNLSLKPVGFHPEKKFFPKPFGDGSTNTEFSNEGERGVTRQPSDTRAAVFVFERYHREDKKNQLKLELTTRSLDATLLLLFNVISTVDYLVSLEYVTDENVNLFLSVR